MSPLYTIGHSTHELEAFIELLRSASITAIADVRSQPYSRHCPQFNREGFETEVAKSGILYVHMGTELGGRTTDPTCIKDGRVSYERLMGTEQFRRGADRLIEGARKYNLVLMCAEKDPLSCHRTILISRYLRSHRQLEIQHIHADGSVEGHEDLERRLLQVCGYKQSSLFQDDDEMLAEAYRAQASRIAYQVGGDA